MFSPDDEIFMQRAIELAKTAAELGEVPVGAVLVLDKKIIGEGYNHPIETHDPSAHAEIIALRLGAKTIQNYRVANSTLYITLEPCIMCVGAIIQARVQRVVYGAFDTRVGAVKSVCDSSRLTQLNHHPHYFGGLMADECGDILKVFFRQRRNNLLI